MEKIRSLVRYYFAISHFWSFHFISFVYFLLFFFFQIFLCTKIFHSVSLFLFLYRISIEPLFICLYLSPCPSRALTRFLFSFAIYICSFFHAFFILNSVTISSLFPSLSCSFSFLSFPLSFFLFPHCSTSLIFSSLVGFWPRFLAHFVSSYTVFSNESKRKWKAHEPLKILLHRIIFHIVYHKIWQVKMMATHWDFYDIHFYHFGFLSKKTVFSSVIPILASKWPMPALFNQEYTTRVNIIISNESCDWDIFLTTSILSLSWSVGAAK